MLILLEKMTMYEDEKAPIDRFYKGLKEEIVDMFVDRDNIRPWI